MAGLCSVQAVGMREHPIRSRGSGCGGRRSQRQRRRVRTDHGRTEATASGGPRHRSRDGREESRGRSNEAGECGDPEVARGQHAGWCAASLVARPITMEYLVPDCSRECLPRLRGICGASLEIQGAVESLHARPSSKTSSWEDCARHGGCAAFGTCLRARSGAGRG
jgi:hypothetical protein